MNLRRLSIGAILLLGLGWVGWWVGGQEPITDGAAGMQVQRAHPSRRIRRFPLEPVQDAKEGEEPEEAIDQEAPRALTCRAAALRFEGMERMAGIVMMLDPPLDTYAERYADLVLAETAGNCGLPVPDRERHRAALERLRREEALPASVLDALDAAVEELLDGG